MRMNTLTKALLVTSTLVSGGANATDVRINGFASIVGGMTTGEGTAKNKYSGAESKATYIADGPTSGIYDEDLSFKPDSNYGIQISADLGQGLQVIGQLTGAGGEDFETNVSWAYVSYELSEEWTIQAGRQRLPLFYYSDFLDVGYAYHWTRIPQVLAAGNVDTFEGVKLAWTPSSDNWDYRFQLYGGAGEQEIASANGNVGVEDAMGFTAQMSNDWLQLRASYLTMDVAFNFPGFSGENGIPQNDSNPLGTDFFGLSANMTFGNAFVIAEYSYLEFDETLGYQFDAAGGLDTEGWYISTGYHMGDFTPHITYAEQTGTDKYQSHGGKTFETVKDQVILGVRWDFHPSAALKFEYTIVSDNSDDEVKNAIGFGAGSGPAGGFGEGNANDVDVATIGVDVIF